MELVCCCAIGSCARSSSTLPHSIWPPGRQHRYRAVCAECHSRTGPGDGCPGTGRGRPGARPKTGNTWTLCRPCTWAQTVTSADLLIALATDVQGALGDCLELCPVALECAVELVVEADRDLIAAQARLEIGHLEAN